MSHRESLSKDVFTYRLEYRFIGLIINAVPERVVDSVVLAFACTNILLERKAGDHQSPESQLQHINSVPN